MDYDYYFYDDCNDICKQKKGTDKDFAEILDILDLIEDANELSEKYIENEKLIKELYDFRMVYNVLLFNCWNKHNEIEVYKSNRHYDGELCFDGEWFIVVAILPNGKQITNHYHMDYWDYFDIPCYSKMKDEFNGYTSREVLSRLIELIQKEVGMNE